MLCFFTFLICYSSNYFSLDFLHSITCCRLVTYCIAIPSSVAKDKMNKDTFHFMIAMNAHKYVYWLFISSEL